MSTSAKSSRSIPPPEASLSAEASKLASGLYLVATPIGNLGDVTLRALEVLRAADVVACEDTRVTQKLLSAYDIHVKTVAYHDHNTEAAGAKLLTALAAGKVVALVSDAGTPLVSDPGYRLVQAAVAAGYLVTAVPGANAVLTALQLSGLPSDRFFFAGFLPPKSAARRAALAELAAVPATLIFYEGISRLVGLLEDTAELFGSRQGAVARELTKRHENIQRGTLADLLTYYKDGADARGEVVVLVGPPGAEQASAADVEALLKEALQAGSVRDAAAVVAARTGLPKREVYALAMRLAQAGSDAGKK